MCVCVYREPTFIFAVSLTHLLKKKNCDDSSCEHCRFFMHTNVSWFTGFFFGYQLFCCYEYYCDWHFSCFYLPPCWFNSGCLVLISYSSLPRFHQPFSVSLFMTCIMIINCKHIKLVIIQFVSSFFFSFYLYVIMLL